MRSFADLAFVFRNVRVGLEIIQEKLAIHDLYVITGPELGVLEVMAEVPMDVLLEWADLKVSRSGRLGIVARAELTRRKAQEPSKP